MSTTSDFPPSVPADVTLSPDAHYVESTNKQGKCCQLIDNTGTIIEPELIKLLAELIESNQFGINALSSSNGVIALNKPRLTHIQINDHLYRLLLYRYQAIIEYF